MKAAPASRSSDDTKEGARLPRTRRFPFLRWGWISVVAGALLIAAGLQLPVTETTVRIGFVGAFVIVSGGVALIAGY